MVNILNRRRPIGESGAQVDERQKAKEIAEAFRQKRKEEKTRMEEALKLKNEEEARIKADFEAKRLAAQEKIDSEAAIAEAKKEMKKEKEEDMVRFFETIGESLKLNLRSDNGKLRLAQKPSVPTEVKKF